MQISPRDITTDGDPAVDHWLISGGDERILLNAAGLNRYGHGLYPDPDTLFFSSTTASTLSPRGRTAANEFYREVIADLEFAAEQEVYRHHASQLRRFLLDALAIDGPCPDVILSPSGTDAHLLAAMLLSRDAARATVFLTVEGSETGSGVPLAITGHRHSRLSIFADAVAQGSIIFSEPNCLHLEIAARDVEGQPRDDADIAHDLNHHIGECTALGYHVVVIVTDVSKTGLVTPSLQTVFELRDRWTSRLDILIDACQFRISTETLSRYLAMQCPVMLTGSKFIGGPPFSGALLIPEEMGSRLARVPLPHGIGDYSLQADWPARYLHRDCLPHRSNFGMLTRWHAALSEIRPFRRIPAELIQKYMVAFHNIASRQIAQHAQFELLNCTQIDRSIIGTPNTWDAEPSIVPFLLKDQNLNYLGRHQISSVYDRLRQPDRTGQAVKLGQPVACGHRDGEAVSALRLSPSASQIVDHYIGNSSVDALAGKISSALARTIDSIRALQLGPQRRGVI